MWEVINAITNFKVYPAVDVDVFHEIVLVDEFLGGVAQFDADVLRPVYGGLEIDVLDVESDKLGAFAGKGAVEEKLDEIKRSRLGADISGEIYFLARNGDASAVGIRSFGTKRANNFGEGNS